MSTIMHKWEPLTTWHYDGHDYTTCRRMRVPNGWLYEVRAYNITLTGVIVISTSATFVPEAI
jgi:hypothetical protein